MTRLANAWMRGVTIAKGAGPYRVRPFPPAGRMGMRAVLPAVVSATCLLLASRAGAEASPPAFRETFDNYGVRAPGFSEACRVGEWPPSLKYIEFRPVSNQPAAVYAAMAPLPAAFAGGKDFDLAFRFRFPADSARAFDVLIQSAQGTVCTLRVGADWSGVSAGRADPSARTDMEKAAFPAFLPNAWYEGMLRVRGGTAEGFIEKHGTMQPVGRADLGDASCAGFNLAGATAVDIDEIRVGDPADGRLAVGAASAAPEPAPIAAGATVAATAVDHVLALAPGMGVAATLWLGQPSNELTVALAMDNGSNVSFRVRSEPAEWSRKVMRDGSPVMEKSLLPDACLTFQHMLPGRSSASRWKFKRFVRPDPRYYEDKEQLTLAARWETLTPASLHGFRVEFRPDAGGVALWFDGRYAGRLDTAASMTVATFRLPAGGAIRDLAPVPAVSPSPYLPLDVGAIANPGALRAASLTVPAGPRAVEDVPFIVVGGDQNADVGVVRENKGSYALECDGYLARTAMSGLPESLLFSVPPAQYIRAWVLCAVEDDSTKDPVLTARLTRLVEKSMGGRGPAIADTTLRLPRPGERLPPGMKEVGRVNYSRDGKRISVPLLLVEIPLKAGEIQEVIFGEAATCTMVPQPYLDFEFVGKLGRAMQQMDRSHKPDPESVSGVHVFGATLEQSPVEMEVVPALFGNAYPPEEKAEMTAVLRPRGQGAFRLEWEIRDIDGRVVGDGAKPVRFAGAGGEQRVAVPLGQKVFGWYSIRFVLLDPAGRRLVEHPASFVLLDKDTRTAGYESPYFCWWFGGAHGGSTNLDLVGPLFRRAGLHRTGIFGLKNEAMGAPWALTIPQIPHQRIRSPGKTEAENRESLAGQIADYRQRYPHVGQAVIIHEGHYGAFPVELLDEPTPVLNEQEKALDARFVTIAERMCSLYRERFPDITRVVGNCGNSLAVMAALFRNEFPCENIGRLGSEDVGQTIPPEYSALADWLLRDLARRFGCEAPTEACYEWKCRTDRDLGARRRAEWGVRDDLIAHACGYTVIPVPGLMESTYSYYNTLWGSGYMFSRYPQAYPYPAYAATAAMTAVLDGARFARRVPTSSLSVYALEFRRGGDRVYALWTARGDTDAALTFAGDGPLKQTGLYGDVAAARTAGRKLALALGEAPVYLTGGIDLKSVAAGARRFPREAPPAGAVITVADSMSAPGAWRLQKGVDPRIDVPAKHGNYPPFRRPGKYILRQVGDAEKGDCLELELLKEGTCPTIMEEYVRLEAADPGPVPGRPHTVGVWVKGNSGWGKLMWEFRDAEGETWLSCGTGGYGCDVYDWSCQASINFDGWHFVQFPLVQDSPVRVPGPGEVVNQWLSSGGNRRIDYPITLTGLVVSMTRRALNLTDMEDVRTVLRFRDLSAYGAE